MGKKVSWFSAIKKALTPNSKQKPVSDHPLSKKSNPQDHEAEKKNTKKWGLGKIKHGPLYRKPSSIEKILGDAEKEHQIIRPASSAGERHTQFIPTRAYQHQPQVNYSPANTAWNQHMAATKIQAACKGYMARRNIRALKGMVRLQGVVRGQNVKRQTMNAMKQMQLLVKVQTQIQSRRVNMVENQVMQHKNDREVESSLGRWNLSQTSEAQQNEEWDDSLLTKEEIEARMQRKTEALMKRERILAYSSSHQWFKTGSAQQMSSVELRSGALPWWWIRIQQQLPKQPQQQLPKQSLKNPSPAVEPSPRPQSKNSRFGLENLNSPRATRTIMQSNNSTQPNPPRNNGNNFSFSMPLRDDDSFTSCPPLSRPNYMTPTISAKAKLRLHDSPSSERSPAASTPGQKRRMSFPLGQSFGSIKWKKASSLFSNKDSSSQRMPGNESYRSMSMLSVDSTTSMPAALGRKPFNRFV